MNEKNCAEYLELKMRELVINERQITLKQVLMELDTCDDLDDAIFTIMGMFRDSMREIRGIRKKIKNATKEQEEA